MELTQDLARCLDLEPSDIQARRLLHHLPASARPIPDIDLVAVADELASCGPVPFGARYFHYMDRPPALGAPRFPLATFTVTFAAIDTLELHDIIVGRHTHNGYQPSRSAGLGSAALKHLCRSADHYGLSIVGKIMPGDRTEPSAARLAGWYRRHGFDIQQRTPGEYLWATGLRPPAIRS